MSFELRAAAGGDGDGVVGRTRHGAGIEVDGEVIAGEAARHRGAQRVRFDDRGMSGLSQSRSGGAGAVSRVAQHPHRSVLTGQ